MALRWANRGNKDLRFADGHRPGTTYKLIRMGSHSPPRWYAWYVDPRGTDKCLGHGNFIQARGHAIDHYRKQVTDG